MISMRVFGMVVSIVTNAYRMEPLQKKSILFLPIVNGIISLFVVYAGKLTII